jgi:predicted acyl esterase
MDAIIGTGKISRREFGIRFDRDITIQMSDGVRMTVDVVRPDGAGKFPALISMAAFNKDIQTDRVWPAAGRSRRIRGTPDAAIEAGPWDYFVPRGYVHIIGSVRGTGKSEGAFDFMGPREVMDTCEVIEWAARQPWCNSHVGMLGIGDAAVHHLLAGMRHPPHLKAIAPIGAFWDNYREFWWPGGILSVGFLRWLISLTNFDVHTQENSLREEMGEKAYRKAIRCALEDCDVRAEPSLVEALRNPDLPTNAGVIDVLLRPTWGRYWEERAVLDPSQIEVPTYLGGASHRPAALYRWPDLKVPKKLVTTPPPYVDRPYTQFSLEVLRWYDYWLKGIDTGIMDEPNVRLFVRGANEWLTADDFPVPGTRFIPFALHENHSLSEIEPWPETASSSYDTRPSHRGFLKYYSAPLLENTEIAGPIVLKLYASCRGTDMDFFVGLWDVDPEGREVCLNRGWLKASHRELDLKRSKPWWPVHTHRTPQPLVPGQVYSFDIDIYATANLFKAGHRIMLKISSADDEPENLGEVKMNHLLSQTSNIVTIYHEERYPSYLLLPVIRGNIIGTYVSGGNISLEKGFMELK